MTLQGIAKGTMKLSLNLVNNTGGGSDFLIFILFKSYLLLMSCERQIVSILGLYLVAQQPLLFICRVCLNVTNICD